MLSGSSHIDNVLVHIGVRVQSPKDQNRDQRDRRCVFRIPSDFCTSSFFSRIVFLLEWAALAQEVEPMGWSPQSRGFPEQGTLSQPLPMSWLSPRTADSNVGVWMCAWMGECQATLKELWIKALYKCSPFNIFIDIRLMQIPDFCCWMPTAYFRRLKISKKITPS